MRILHFPVHMNQGGIETMVRVLANEQSKNHEVTVCTIDEQKSTDVQLSNLSHQVDVDSLHRTKQGFSIKILWKVFVYLFRNRNNFDVVHLHSCFYYFVLPVFVLQPWLNFVYTVHSDANMENTKWDKKIFFLKKFAFKHRLLNGVTISKASQNSFEELYHANNNLIYNGIPKPEFSSCHLLDKHKITKDSKILFHAGRISTPKNQLVLCKVCDRLIKEGYDIILLIAGDNQDKEIFKTIQPYFSERIKYLGVLNGIPNYFASSDIMCLPSIWEGMPVTLLEALSTGCIPVCSSVGGIVNVINDSKNGFLSEDSSEQCYYQALKRCLDMTDQELIDISKKCIKSFEPFRIENVVAQYVDLYKSLV